VGRGWGWGHSTEIDFHQQKKLISFKNKNSMKTTELSNGKRATTRVVSTCVSLFASLLQERSPKQSTGEKLKGVIRHSLRKSVTPALLFFFCTGLHAQVTIGGLTEPASGAILDLNSNVKGGLILSNVTITNPERIPHGTNVFQGIDDGNDRNNQELRGTMVYNDGQNPAVPPGVYIWNGSCWTKNGGEVIINPPAITVDGAIKSAAVTNLGSSAAVALAVASPQPDVSYEWYQSTTASNTGGDPADTGETYTTPNDLTATTYYYCKATSLACPSVNAVSEVITVIVLDPALPSGAGNLIGTSCFDVAAGNNSSNGCGALSSRIKRVFTNSFTEVYTFSVLTGSDAVTGLSFDFKNLNATYPVIESLSTSPDSKTVTVTFHTELDTWAQGLTRAQPLQAELYAIYNTNQATKLTLSVSDCRCCPGLLVPGGEYNDVADPIYSPSGSNASNTDGSTAKIIMEASSKTGYDLCYYYRDATSGSAGSSSTYAWNTTDGTTNAMNVCQTMQGVDAVDIPGGWRLPKFAELAQIGQLVSSYTSAEIDKGVGSQEHVDAAISGNTMGSDAFALPAGSNTTTGTYNLRHNYYWSCRMYDATNYIWMWNFTPSSRKPILGSPQQNISYVRCVRRF
jgi:uncharacterized protein (TIGR02145 family)